jgi:hypothetical protein
VTITEFLDNLRVWSRRAVFSRPGPGGRCIGIGFDELECPTDTKTIRRIQSALDDDLACDPELRAAIFDAVGLA